MATSKKTAPKKKAAPSKSPAKKSAPKKSAKKAPAKKTAPKKAAKKSAGKTNKLGVKNSLVNNINARKEKGTSRPKKKSGVSKESYQDMKNNWKD
jgi:hypothetical protein